MGFFISFYGYVDDKYVVRFKKNSIRFKNKFKRTKTFLLNKYKNIFRIRNNKTYYIYIYIIC